MRFPSVLTLAQRAREVLVRFPWTMAAAVFAAVAAVVATTKSGDDALWGRIAMVAALGLPLTVALTLLAEERRWSPGRAAAINAAGVSLLVLLYFIWPGPDQKHELIRYFQLSAGFHLLVAFLPFPGQRESGAFWQYNPALRFLLDHGDQGAVAAAVPGGLPTLDWDSIPASRERRNQAATRILAGAHLTYVSEYSRGSGTGDPVHLFARPNRATPTAGYDWVLDVSSWDKTPRHAGADSVRVWFDTSSSVARVIVGPDSLAFDLGRLARMLAGKSVLVRNDVPTEDLRLEAVTSRRRGALVLQTLSGRRTGDTVRVDTWSGKLLLGRGIRMR